MAAVFSWRARSRVARDVAIAQIARHAAGGTVIALELGQPIAVGRICTGLEAIQPRGIFPEDRALDRSGRRTERSEAELALHVLGDLQTTQAFDLPLRRAGPHRVGAPHHS